MDGSVAGWDRPARVVRAALRATGRGLVPLALAAAAVAVAAPARAHVSVRADRPEVGASGVTVTFTAEAESTSAGISSLRVVLPAGLRPDQVSLVAGPNGWTLRREADGYTVAGPPLATGVDASYSVRIGQLPAGATTLAFKTLQGYADGRVDRWIEVPVAGQPEPDNPAPVLVLTPAGGPPPSPAASPDPPPPSAVAGPAVPRRSGGRPPWTLVGLVAAVLVVILAVVVRGTRAGRR